VLYVIFALHAFFFYLSTRGILGIPSPLPFSVQEPPDSSDYFYNCTPRSLETLSKLAIPKHNFFHATSVPIHAHMPPRKPGIDSCPQNTPCPPIRIMSRFIISSSSPSCPPTTPRTWSTDRLRSAEPVVTEIPVSTRCS